MAINAFRQLMKDIVTVVKQDGTRFEEVAASVGKNQISIMDTTVAIEDGDTIERQIPGGIVERYTVLDAGYHNALHSIPARYVMDVRKESAIPRVAPVPPQNFYLNGHNSRINNNSIDASVNTVSMSSSQVFAELRQALSDAETDEGRREALMASIAAMETSQGTPGFLPHYQAFMQAAANHMTVIVPLLPALAQLIS